MEKAKVAVFIGSASDESTVAPCADILKKLGIPFRFTVTSAHRTPERTAELVDSLEAAGCEVFICAAGMAAHLCGVIASMTTVPVIGVPINSTLDGMDALLAIVQMPPGIPVATVGINGALNAGILAVQMLAVGDEQLQDKLAAYKEDLKKKIVKANEELAKVSFKYKMN